MKKLIVLIIIFLLTGCSYRELNDLAIGNALGIDYIENQYKITIQVLDLKKNSESNEEEKAVIYEATGESIPTALRNISLSYPKTIYLGHLELVILGKSILNQNFEELFDYFLRSPEARNDFDILINPSGTAEEIIDFAKDKAKSFPSKEILSTLQNGMNKQGSTVKMNMEEFISIYLEEGIDPVVTTIEKKEDSNKLTGIMVIDNNYKNIKLTEKEAIAYNMINENFYDIVQTIEYNNEKLDMIIVQPKTSIKTNIKDNKINVTINISASSQISEVRQKINLEDDQVQKELQNKLDKLLESYVEELLYTCKNENIDVLGLKNNIYKHHYKDYKKYKNENIYEIANITVKATTKVYRFGSIYRSTKGD